MRRKFLPVFIWSSLTILCLSPCSSLDAQGVYSENFNEMLPTVVLEGWERYDEPLAEGSPSLWVYKRFLDRVAIAQISNIYGPGVHHRGTWITRKDEVWRDGSIRVLMTCTDNDVVGLLFRYVDPQNFYVFDMTEQKRRPWDGMQDSRWARVQKCRNGEYTLLTLDESRTYHNNDGIWHEMRVDMQGDHFQFFFDGTQIFDVVDPSQPIMEGSIGLASWAQSSVLFDDLRVDGILIDDFNRDVKSTTPPGWTAYEEPGLREGPAHWQVGKIGDEQALVQYANAHKPNDDRRGTWIVLDDRSWRRMTLDWDMYNTDDDVAGVLFHYQDAENFYIMEMTLQPRAPDRNLEKTPWARLRKCVSGEYRVIAWVGEAVYQKNRWHHGRITVDGLQIRVWMDDNLVLEVIDEMPAPQEGSIGFSSYAQQVVAFDDVRVIGPLPVPVYESSPAIWGDVKRRVQNSP